MLYRTMHPQFNKTFVDFQHIPNDFCDALWNYFAYGMSPGSFGHGLITNNFYRAVQSAHYALSAHTFRELTCWLAEFAPPESFGSVENYDKWILKTNAERCDIMIEYRLRPSEFDILRGNAIA